jgi:hypothetical protein
MGMLVTDGIGPRLDILALGAAAHTLGAMESGAERVEYYAQTNAPWHDRTGMARDGLNASVFEEDGNIVLELAHGVEYGYWLEVIQDGQYAIIMPTLEALGPEILREAGAGMVSIEGMSF